MHASLIRNRSDYEDFYICSVEDTVMLMDGAEQFLEVVKTYLFDLWKKTSDTISNNQR